MIQCVPAWKLLQEQQRWLAWRGVLFRAALARGSSKRQLCEEASRACPANQAQAGQEWSPSADRLQIDCGMECEQARNGM